LGRKPVVVENSAARRSSDAGLLVVREFDEPPSRLTLDLDGCDDPAHGAQQLTLFHGVTVHRPRGDFPRTTGTGTFFGSSSVDGIHASGPKNEPVPEP
jgi:hypothetical protein